MPKKQSFMKGKSLAAAMGLESSCKPGLPSDLDSQLCADYRSDFGSPNGDVVPQHNFTRKYLEILLSDPLLLDGFSAALTQLFEEGFDSTGGIPECVAAASYEACHSLLGQDGNRYTEPDIHTQLERFGLSGLSVHIMEVSHA